MKRYIQYLHYSTGYTPPVRLIPACGSGAYIPCDGRWSLATCIRHAQKRHWVQSEIHREYPAFQIVRETGHFSNAPITGVIMRELWG